MGVWGTGPFDNDGAADLLIYLERASGPQAAKILARELASGDEHSIVAVAAILDKGRWNDQRNLLLADGRNDARLVRERHSAHLSSSLKAKALAGLQRIARTGSKLGWTKPENERRWMQNVHRLIQRLGGIVSKDPRVIVRLDPGPRRRRLSRGTRKRLSRAVRASRRTRRARRQHRSTWR